MCGACRLTIGGKTRFVCIDGPEFDGDQVDWTEMFERMRTFKGVEQEEMANLKDHLEPTGNTTASEVTAKECPATAVAQDDEAVLTDRNASWQIDSKAMSPKSARLFQELSCRTRILSTELLPT